jgi:CDP-diacylglycerol--glycerol-3-phosphate 3-phosphatidyltransferase
VWNLPNILTYGRILAIPLVIYLLDKCSVNAEPTAVDLASRHSAFWAAVVFTIAAATDFFDGWIARNFNLGSLLGRFLDPLADKLIVIACLVMMVQLERCPAWIVILLITREISITSLRAIASAEGLEIRVSQGGKWKTAFQLTGLIGLLVHYEYPVSWLVVEMTLNFHLVGLALLCLSLVMSLYSAGLYFRSFAVQAAATRN